MVKFIRKARGHFVLLIQAGMRLIECISGLIPQEGVTSTCLFTLTEKQRRRCTFVVGSSSRTLITYIHFTTKMAFALPIIAERYLKRDLVGFLEKQRSCSHSRCWDGS